MEATARAAQKVSGRAGSWIAPNDRGFLPPRPPGYGGWRRGRVMRAEIRDYVIDQVHNKIEYVI
jgi:hypothetical protein